MKTPRGRLYQDSDFVFTEFDGLQIEKLVVCENPETKEPIIVYLKAQGQEWHQFFIDAGFGVWANWGEPETEDDSYDYIDQTIALNLLGKRITKIWCESDQSNCKITIELENKEKLILKTVDPELFDSASELIRK